MADKTITQLGAAGVAATNDKVEVEQTPAASRYVTVAEISAAAPVFVASGVGHAKGLVPDPGAVVGTNKYLAENATFKAVPQSIDALTAIGGVAFGVPFTPSTVLPSIVIMAVYAESDGLVSGEIEFSLGATVVGRVSCANGGAAQDANKFIVTLPVATNESVQIDNVVGHDPNVANAILSVYYRTLNNS